MPRFSVMVFVCVALSGVLSANAAAWEEAPVMESTPSSWKTPASFASTLGLGSAVDERSRQNELQRGRSVLQTDLGVQDEDYECSLSDSEVNAYLDTATRTWLVDDSVLEAVENDLQAIINCTQTSDVVLFDFEDEIRIVSRLVIPWRLTLSAVVESTGLVDGVFPLSARKASFRCRGDGNGAFLLKSTVALLANLQFERCALNATAGDHAAVVDVERCQSGRPRESIQLHHVSFRDNTLVEAPGLRVNTPSCAEVEMIDVAFLDNACSGVCGAVLSASNTLRNIEMEGNSPLEAFEVAPVVLSAPPGSESTVYGLQAEGNGIAVLNITRASFSLFESALIGNVLEIAGEESLASCMIVDTSTLDMNACLFERNEGRSGAVFYALQSKITLSYSTVIQNTAAELGVLYMASSSTLVAESCRISSNIAEEGGAVYAHSSRFEGRELVMTNNSAENGGCFYMSSMSSLTVSSSDVSSNRAANSGAAFSCWNQSRCDAHSMSFHHNIAHFGAVISLMSKSSGSMRDFHMANNKARRHGGAAFVDESSLSVTECQFEDGEAKAGGFLYLTKASEANVTHCSLHTGSADRGGCICSTGSRVRVVDASVTDSEATEGGALSLTASDLIIQSTSVSRCTASSGGVLYSSLNSTVAILYSTFSDNTALIGGAVLGEGNVSITASETHFASNSAEKNGGTCHMEASTATFSHCTFLNGKAEQGGCLSCVSSSVCQVDNSNVSDCSASIRGGALVVREADARLDNSMLTGNSAADGGAIDVRKASFTGEGLTVSNNSASDNGGGLYCGENSTIRVTRSEFSNNEATLGGAVVLETNATGNFVRVRFVSNSVSTSGGSSYIEDSAALFKKCLMELSSARIGGCLYLTNSSVEIDDSRIKNSEARQYGGLILAGTRSSLTARRVTMSRGRAPDFGGGIALENSTLVAQGLTLSRCSTQDDGGALFANGTSTVLCFDCLLEDNVAEGRGGAIYLETGADRPPFFQSVALQLDKCVVRNNTAEYGGGLHFATFSSGVDCSDFGLLCSVAVIRQTTFLQNRALHSGAAVFSSYLSLIWVDCNTLAANAQIQFVEAGTWQNMAMLNSLDNVCKSWKQNEAVQYGQEIASYGRFVNSTVVYEGRNRTESVEGTRFDILDHRSGDPLPAIRIEVTDELGQVAPTGVNNDLIKAELTSPDHFFTGVVTVDLHDGIGSFAGLSGYQRPGKYRLKIKFSEDSMPTLTIVVHIRECSLGEQEARSGLFCEQCGADTYALRPEDECNPCPDDAECNSKAIRPNDGYWHKTPCSEHIQRCLSRKACDYKGREEKLLAIEEALETCDFSDETVANYSDAQCSEGYEGPLCGSCQEGYGRSQSFACESCFTGFGNVLLVLLSLVFLMFLTTFPIRSNLYSRVSAGSHGRQCETQPLPSASAQSGAVNVEMMEMSVSGRVPMRDMERQRTPQPTSREIEEAAEISKWKAAELFKITVNFVQIFSVAISINVQWTAAMIAFFEGASKQPLNVLDNTAFAAEFIGAVTSEAVNRSVDCIVSSDSSVDRSVVASIIDVLVPVAVIGLFSLFWLVRAVVSSRHGYRLSHKLALSAIAVLYISYISLTKTLVNTLSCVDVYDSLEIHDDSQISYWAADTSLECYSGSHAVLAGALGWPFLFVFGLGFPISMAVTITTYVKEDYKLGWIYRISGFMYRAYRREFVFWESAVMLRKAFLAVVVVFAHRLGPILQVVLAVFVLAMALYFHTVFRPYREEFDVLNEMEGISILISLVTFVSSLLFVEDIVPSWGRTLATIGILLCNVMMLFFFIAYILIFAAEYLRTVLAQENVPYDSNGGTLYILRVYVVRHLFGSVFNRITRLCERTGTPQRRRTE